MREQHGLFYICCVVGECSIKDSLTLEENGKVME
jgi:hypothetical protein